MKKSGDLALQVAEALNGENPLFPAEHSSVPFVFDGEILLTATTVSTLWSGMVEGGFTIHNPVITSIEPLVPTDFSIFRKSWEMETFFKTRIPRYAYKVSIEGIGSDMILLLFRNEDKTYSLMGLKAGAQ